MFHVWYNFNMKVTTKTKTNLLIRGIKRGFKVVQECFYEHCYLLIFDTYLNTYITSMIYVLCNIRLQQLFFLYLKLLSFVKRIPISCMQVLLSKMY